MHRAVQWYLLPRAEDDIMAHAVVAPHHDVSDIASHNALLLHVHVRTAEYTYHQHVLTTISSLLTHVAPEDVVW